VDSTGKRPAGSETIQHLMNKGPPAGTHRAPGLGGSSSKARLYAGATIADDPREVRIRTVMQTTPLTSPRTTTPPRWG
jgi:hypothetical protein